MEKSKNSNKVKKYGIEIYYQTGSTFGSSEETSTLDLEWNNLDIIKDNLNRIREHHKWYEDNHGYRIYSERDKSRIKKPKCADAKRYSCIKLLTDDKKELEICAFWVGYFETLYYAKVITLEDPELTYITSQGKYKDLK